MCMTLLNWMLDSRDPLVPLYWMVAGTILVALALAAVMAVRILREKRKG